MCDDSERSEYKKDVEPGAKEEEFEGGKPARFAFCFDEFHDALKERAGGWMAISIEEGVSF